MNEYSEFTPLQKAIMQAAIVEASHSDADGIIDNDAHFVIDSISRQIVNTGKKNTIVQYDHNSERITFELIRYIEEHDMINCNKITINYLNNDVPGLYEVDDLAASEDKPAIIFSWLISSNATQKVGKLAFAIEFECADEDGKATYKWHTGINEDLKVISTIANNEFVAYDNVDILEQWKRKLFSGSSENLVEEINKLKEGFTELKKSVSDGKEKMAGAITDKGVETASDDSFDTMAENVEKIRNSNGGLNDEIVKDTLLNESLDIGNTLIVNESLVECGIGIRSYVTHEEYVEGEE